MDKNVFFLEMSMEGQEKLDGAGLGKLVEAGFDGLDFGVEGGLGVGKDAVEVVSGKTGTGVAEDYTVRVDEGEEDKDCFVTERDSARRRAGDELEGALHSPYMQHPGPKRLSRSESS